MITVKSFEFNFFSENTYLLYDDTKEAVLIDCGCSRREEEKELSEFIEKNELQLKRLLCTHMHIDYVLGNGYIYHTYGLKPEMHRIEMEQLPSPRKQAEMFGIQDRVEDIPAADFPVGNQTIAFGSSALTTLLVPGHSPGSLCFYSETDAFVIVGDALFAGSIGRTDLWGGNQEMLIAAIKDKLLSLPDETIIYPGHGPATNVIDELLNNPFL